MAAYTTRRGVKWPLVIELNSLASIIVALLLWLVPLGPWSYAIGAAVLVILVAILIITLPWQGRLGATAFKFVLCVIAVGMLLAILVPTGIARFNLERNTTGSGPPSPLWLKSMHRSFAITFVTPTKLIGLERTHRGLVLMLASLMAPDHAAGLRSRQSEIAQSVFRPGSAN